jgi:hypothetical protein
MAIQTEVPTMIDAPAFPPGNDWTPFNEAQQAEKLYFVQRWRLAELYTQLFRSKVWHEDGKRPTIDGFLKWVNGEFEIDYDRSTLMQMVDVFNAYSRLPQDGIPAKVMQIGFAKAAAVIPWVSQYPDKADTIFTICEGTDDIPDMRHKLRTKFPLRRPLTES